MKDSTVRTAGLLRAQKPAVLEKIREEMRGALAKYTKGDVVELPMPAWVASAVKSELDQSLRSDHSCLQAVLANGIFCNAVTLLAVILPLVVILSVECWSGDNNLTRA